VRALPAWLGKPSKYRLGYKLTDWRKKVGVSGSCAQWAMRLIGGTNRDAKCDPRSRINFPEPAPAPPGGVLGNTGRHCAGL